MVVGQRGREAGAGRRRVGGSEVEAADPDGGQRVGVAVRRGMLVLAVGRRDMLLLVVGRRDMLLLLVVVVVVVGRRGAAAPGGGPGREVLPHDSRRVGVERDASGD